MDDQNPNPTIRMDTPTPAPQPDADSTSFGAPADPPPGDPPPAASATFEPATPPSYVPPALPPEALPPAQPAAPAAPGAGFPLVPQQSSWAQPHHRDRGGRMWSVIAGLGLLALGLWFFADRTLGLDMPDLRWSQLWPVILIGIGLLILWGALRRERR